MQKLFIMTLATCSCLLSACTKSENELFAQALKYDQSRIQATNYRSALESCEATLETIEHMLSQRPDSDLAHRLVSGEVRISGITLKEYKALTDSLQPLAEAEQDPLACALLMAKSLEETSTAKSPEEDINQRFVPTMNAQNSTMLSRAGALDQIAMAYAERGQREEALRILSLSVEVACSLTNRNYFGRVCQGIQLAGTAHHYAEIGFLPQAIETAKRIEKPESRSRAFAYISIAYAKAGQPENADRMFSQMLATSGALEEDFNPAWTLVNLAQAFLSEDQNDTVCKLLSQSLEAARPMQHEASMLLSRTAITYAQFDQPLQALEIADTIENEYCKAEALIAIAEQYIELGQPEEAVRILTSAIHAVESIKENDSLTSHRLNLAKAYHSRGQNRAATEMLSEAADAASQAHDGRCKHQATFLAQIGTLFARMEEYGETGKLLSQALETARLLESETLRAIVLTQIADHYANLEQNEKVDEILVQATDAARKGKNGRFTKEEALAGIAKMYAKLGKFDLAISTAESIENEGWKSGALKEIAVQCAKSGHFAQALETAGIIGSDFLRVTALVGIATAYNQSATRMSPEEVALLSEIVSTRYPMKLYIQSPPDH